MKDKKEYKSLYRKWRPEKFEDVVGQEKAIRILRNSVIKDNTGHAYLFAGPRGTGKTSVARIMAKAINCEDLSEGEPCNSCNSCRKIESERSLDVIEIDGASNRGIGEIRDLREEVNYMPAEANYKVYIIDEVHMLTNEAFNALLKTLEEPPERVMFIFATTEPQKIPETIISRCQVFEFKEIPQSLIQERIAEVAKEEGLEITDRALQLIAKKGRGSMRDALVVLEQMFSYKDDQNITEEDLNDVLGVAGEEIVENYLKGILKHEKRKTMDLIKEISAHGKDYELFLEDIIDRLKDEIVKNNGEASLDIPQDKLITISRKTLDLLNEIRFAPNKRLSLEIGTLELHELISEEETDKNIEYKEKDEKEANERSETSNKKQIKKEKTKTDNKNKIPDKRSSEQSGKWVKVLEDISDRRISIAAFLQEGDMKKLDEEILLEFHPDFSFHKESLEREENFSFLREMIDKHYGEECSISIKYNSEIKKEDQSEPDLVEEKTEMVLEKFKGRVIERSGNLF